MQSKVISNTIYAGFLLIVFSKDHKLTLKSNSEQNQHICLCQRIEITRA